MRRDGRPGKGGWGLPQSALGPAQLCHQEMTGEQGRGKVMGQRHRASRQKSKQEERTEAVLVICPVPKPLPVGGPFFARISRARSSWIHFMNGKVRS